MPEAKYIKSADVPVWLAELAATRRVLAPREEGGTVVFRPFAADTPPVLDREPVMPPKGSVFPAGEALLHYRYTKDMEHLGDVDVELIQGDAAEPTVVFGSRPCGARGFLIFDRVYDGQKYKDTPYLARRAATAFVSIACDTPETTCFCHWVDSGPDDTAGSDVLLTPVSGGYVAEAVSDKGGELLSSKLFSAASDKAAEAETVRQKARAALSEAPDISDSAPKLLARFDDLTFWERESAKCISCGACTYLCPTCYCFSITDEAYGMSGSRIRSWDNCMSYQFTLEASGHNPRPTKAHRLRNRVGHKFSYYPDIHEGVIACCGCGRCIKHCPVCVDIREIVIHACEYQESEAAEPAEAS